MSLQSKGDSITTDISGNGMSQSSPDLRSQDTVHVGPGTEAASNENSGSLSDDAFKLKLDDIGVEVIRDKDDSVSNISKRLEDTHHHGTDEPYKKDSTDNIKDNDNSVKENLEEKFSPSYESGYSLRKIPKSKTFDSGMGPYFGSNIDNRRQSYDQSKEFETPDGISSSQKHVFMTSQECFVVPGCKLPRETIASRLRFEKQHLSHDKICGYDDYLTPLQRKDKLIKDLKRQVRELTISLEERDKEIQMYKQHFTEETSKLVQSKDDEIGKLRNELTKLRQSYDDISSFCEESIMTASKMERKAEDLKEALASKENEHQRLYLEMYRKGQESAKFEREEELERIAIAGGCKVTISELVKKLAWTEVELAKWQTLKRQESYNTASRPETEADTMLKFLKDCLFHYITDDREADNHLRAMIKILNYSEKQISAIKGSKMIQKIEKKRRTYSATVPPNY